jgi:hypothetical protein
VTALDADDAQKSRHMARQMTEHAEIMYAAFLRTEIPRPVIDAMMIAWWTELWKPRMPDLPDFTKLFDTGDD